MKPKIKKVKKWKYSRREGLERLGFLFNMKGEYNAPNEVNGEDVYKIFMATQPQPIKEESKPFTGHYCVDCHGTGQNKKGDRCKNYDAWLNDHTKNMAEESKDIECPASSQFATDDVYLWAIRITDTLNSLTKRNNQ